MFTVEVCSEVRQSKHLSNHIFDSLSFRKYIGYECHPFFQNVQNLMRISKIERKIEQIFLVFQIIAFDIIPAESTYTQENTCDRESII